MDDSDIHKYHEELKNKNRPRNKVESFINPMFQNPQSMYTAGSRWNYPSFRSKYFNVSNGLLVLSGGETKTLAEKTVVHQHSGVLTGFTQYFAGCDDTSEIVTAVTWGLRINGNRVVDFPDFIGELSKSYLPCNVFFPLMGDAVSSISVSPGSGPTEQIQTVSFLATNNSNQSVILSGRLIGYSFPTSELNDEFARY